VVGGWVPRQSTGWMWDLTVPGDHDFYVDTAATPVLVHNCQVECGSTDLSQAVQAKRVELGDKYHNYAADRLDDGSIIVGRSGGGLHAEEDVIGKAGADESWICTLSLSHVLNNAPLLRRI
jgi:hypothetical protein